MRPTIAILVWLAAAASPAAAGTIDFCEGYSPKNTDYLLKTAKGYVAKKQFEEAQLNYMAMGLCDNPSDPERQKLLDEWGAIWAQATGGQIVDWKETLHMARDRRFYDVLHRAFCKTLATESEDERDKNPPGIAASAFNCPDQVDPTAWNLDMPKVTEAARAAYLVRCLADSWKYEPGQIIGWCWQDMLALDKTKYDAEAKQHGINAVARGYYRRLWDDAEARVKKGKEAIEAIVKKKPDYQKLLDASKAGWDRWHKDTAAHQAALDDAWKYTAETEKGCSQVMEKHVWAYVAAKNARTEAELRAAVNDPIGFHLAMALGRCMSQDKRYLEAYWLFFEATTTTMGGIADAKLTPHRGPRYAANAAALAVLAELRNDNPKFPLETLGKDWSKASAAMQDVENGIYGPDLSSNRPGSGVIAAVKKAGAGTEITFKAERYKVLDHDCRKTNRVSRINSDGTVEYEQNCKVIGEHWESKTTPPIVVTTALPKTVAKGKFLTFFAKGEAKGRPGVPVGVYTDRSQKKLLSYMAYVP